MKIGSVEEILATHLLHQQMSSLRAHIGSNTSLTSSAHQYLQHQDNFEQLNDFLRPDVPQQDNDQRQIHRHTMAGSQKDLKLEICLFFTRVMMQPLPNPGLVNAHLSSQFLFELQRLSAITTYCQESIRTSYRPKIHLAREEIMCTPGPGINRDWREKLKSFTDLESKHRQESLCRVVEEICRDLEGRCEVAEQPYRAEVEKVKLLQHEACQFEAKIERLQGHVEQKEALLESAKEEIAELKCALRDLRTENEDSVGTITGLRAELQDVGRRQERDMECLKEEMKSVNFAHRAETAMKAEHTEKLKSQINEAIRSAAGFERQVAVLGQDLATSENQRNDSKEKYDTLRSDFEATRKTLAELEAHRSTLNTKLQSLTNQHDAALSELELAREEQSELSKKSTAVLVALQTKHLAERQGLLEDLESQKSMHEAEERHLTSLLQKAEHDTKSLGKQLSSKERHTRELRAEVGIISRSEDPC